MGSDLKEKVRAVLSIDLSMIDAFKFSTDLDVRINDINYGGHLGNDRYLSLFHEARLRYLKQFCCSELDIGDQTSLIMSQAHIDFKAQAFWGDRLTVFVRIAQITPIKFRMEYLIVSSEDHAKQVASGYTVLAGFDYRNQQVKKLPVRFIQDIQQFEQTEPKKD